MASVDRYARPVEQVEWEIPGAFETVFEWEYEHGRESLLTPLREGQEPAVERQHSRIDWSQDLDPENPQELPDETIVDLRLATSGTG